MVTFLLTVMIIVVIVVLVVNSLRLAGWLTKPLAIRVETRICPFCKSRIPKDAVVCKYCRRDIKPKEIMEDEDYVAQSELRLEAIEKVMNKFSAKYPEVIFKYDKTLGDIIIKVPSSHPDPKPKPEMIQKKMIEELINFGVDAKARLFSADTIKTRGFFEGAIEDTLTNVRKEQKQKFDSGLCPECNQKIEPEFTECSSCGFDFNKLKFKTSKLLDFQQDSENKPGGQLKTEESMALKLYQKEQKKIFDKGFCPSCNEKIEPNSTKCLCGFDFYENNLIQQDTEIKPRGQPSLEQEKNDFTKRLEEKAKQAELNEPKNTSSLLNEESESYVCGNCNAKISHADNFCSSCDFELVDVCDACGETISGKDNFCPHCKIDFEVLEPSFLLFLEQKKIFDKGFCPSCNEKIDRNSTKCLCGFDFYENNLIQ
jgi:predicted amidophosphoribosyltransferase